MSVTPQLKLMVFAGSLAIGLGALLSAFAAHAAAKDQATTTTNLPEHSLADREAFLSQWCSGCHNDKARTAGMSVQPLRTNDLSVHNEVWEKILMKLRAGQMPPSFAPKRPSAEQAAEFSSWLERSLDTSAATHLNPGRNPLRRMNRAEYANAVRDLLDLDIDVSDQLPIDDSGYGFDNIADVLSFSPILMQRYLIVARKVARLATGRASTKPQITVFKVPKDLPRGKGVPSFNERSNDNLPLESRGGGSFKYYALHDGTYRISAYLNSNDLGGGNIKKENAYHFDTKLKAGSHDLGVAFDKSSTLPEIILRQYELPRFAYIVPEPPTPLRMQFVVDGKEVSSTSVPSYEDGERYGQNWNLRDALQIEVTGPTEVTGPGDTPSRRKVFVCRPKASSADSERKCAEKIFTALVDRAYRRSAGARDIAPIMKVYDSSKKMGGFEGGIEAGLTAILVSPHFLLVNEIDNGVRQAKGKPRLEPIGEHELATKLSLFLWSSIPDKELLGLADRGQLRKKAVLERQVTRMLADPRSDAFIKNFAGQWLYLRSLDYHEPNKEMFKDFDIRLRTAMRTETELYFSYVARENRPIMDFIKSDYTFLNERLAQHYGIPGIKGPAFRRVELDSSWQRGGLLSQASILMATSADNRTSIVRRGKWILETLLAAPPPAPPPNVPSLKDVPEGKEMTVREQMEMHRRNPVCASCHVGMDPLGFALEGYNAIGALRELEAGKPVDTKATMPDGASFSGKLGLEEYILQRKERFVDAFTEKLLTYALGRGVESSDMPTVRDIRRKSASDDYRFKSILIRVVESLPFQMRSVKDANPS